MNESHIFRSPKYDYECLDLLLNLAKRLVHHREEIHTGFGFTSNLSLVGCFTFNFAPKSFALLVTGWPILGTLPLLQPTQFRKISFIVAILSDWVGTLVNHSI